MHWRYSLGVLAVLALTISSCDQHGNAGNVSGSGSGTSGRPSLGETSQTAGPDTLDLKSSGVWIVINTRIQVIERDAKKGIVKVTLHGPVTRSRTIRTRDRVEAVKDSTTVDTYRVSFVGPSNEITQIEGVGEGRNIRTLLGNLIHIWEGEVDLYLALYYGDVVRPE